jgi:hypothetical protein
VKFGASAMAGRSPTELGSARPALAEGCAHMAGHAGSVMPPAAFSPAASALLPLSPAMEHNSAEVDAPPGAQQQLQQQRTAAEQQHAADEMHPGLCTLMLSNPTGWRPLRLAYITSSQVMDYGILHPGDQLEQRTFPGHVWALLDVHTRQEVLRLDPVPCGGACLTIDDPAPAATAPAASAPVPAPCLTMRDASPPDAGKVYAVATGTDFGLHLAWHVDFQRERYLKIDYNCKRSPPVCARWRPVLATPPSRTRSEDLPPVLRVCVSVPPLVLCARVPSGSIPPPPYGEVPSSSAVMAVWPRATPPQ